MLTKNVYQLRAGDKLMEDVLTPLGSTLIIKDTVLTQRDIEVLIAFTIDTVKVAPSTNEITNKKDGLKTKGVTSAVTPLDTSKVITNSTAPISLFTEKERFNETYRKMLEVMRNVNNSVNINEPIPLLEVRNQLIELFENIANYNVISFVPPNFVESDYALHKSVVTALTAYHIAKASGQPQKDWMPIALAGLLMDIGNQKIDKNILNKEGKLTPKEMELIKKTYRVWLSNIIESNSN